MTNAKIVAKVARRLAKENGVPLRFVEGKKFKKCEGCEFWPCDECTYFVCREMGAKGRREAQKAKEAKREANDAKNA